MASPLLKDIKNSSILVVGANRGLGLAVVQHLSSNRNNKIFATVRGPADGPGAKELRELPVSVIGGVELAADKCDSVLVEALKASNKDISFDYLFVVAGYFTTETFEKLNLSEQRLMIEICALAPLRISQSLVLNNILRKGSKIILITSEGGSIGLRTEKEGGANYGHHMSKTAANMMGRLLAWDVKPRGIAVQMQHPGFLRTDMTQHYAHLYDELGAVPASEAVAYIVSAASDLTLETTGRFVAAMGSKGLGLGIWALDEPEKLVPGGELPW